MYVEENDINYVFIATASPKANGQVERVNRVLSPMLAKISDYSTGKLWYKRLAKAVYVLNNTVHSTTRASPSKMLFRVNQRGDRDLEQVRSYAIENNEKSHE